MPQMNMPSGQTEEITYPVTLIHAPSGFGKTTAAATASEFFVEQKPVKEMIHLKDMCWLQFDRDGIRTLKSMGLDPDFYDFSMDAQDAPIWVGKVKLQLKKIAEASKKAPYYAVVTDTLSTMLGNLESYHLAQVTDSRLAYNRANQDMMSIINEILAIRGRHLWLVHSKAFSAAAGPAAGSEAAKAQAAAAVAKDKTLLPGEYDVKIALNFSASDRITRICSQLLAVDSSDKGVRSLVLDNSTTYQTKQRYPGLLPNVMEVNIRKMFETVEQFDKKVKQGSK